MSDLLPVKTAIIAPHADIALLSNSNRIGAAEIEGAVLRIDRAIMKSYAGNDSVFLFNPVAY